MANLLTTTTSDDSPLDASGGGAGGGGGEKPQVSQFLTLQSLTNFAAMTGAIAAAWNVTQKLDARASSLWVPFIFAIIWAIASVGISWAGLKKQGENRVNAGTAIGAVLVAFINALVLTSAVIGTRVAAT